MASEEKHRDCIYCGCYFLAAVGVIVLVCYFLEAITPGTGGPFRDGLPGLAFRSGILPFVICIFCSFYAYEFENVKVEGHEYNRLFQMLRHFSIMGWIWMASFAADDSLHCLGFLFAVGCFLAAEIFVVYRHQGLGEREAYCRGLGIEFIGFCVAFYIILKALIILTSEIALALGPVRWWCFRFEALAGIFVVYQLVLIAHCSAGDESLEQTFLGLRLHKSIAGWNIPIAVAWGVVYLFLDLTHRMWWGTIPLLAILIIIVYVYYFRDDSKDEENQPLAPGASSSTAATA